MSSQKRSPEKLELVSKEISDIYYVRNQNSDNSEKNICGAIPRRQRFTQSKVYELPFCTNSQLYCYDEEVAGFGVRIGHKKRSYFVEGDVKGGAKSVRITIGDITKISLKDGRDEARKYFFKMRQGINPREEIKRVKHEWEKKEDERRRKTVSLESAVNKFLNERRNKGKSLKPGTIKEYRNIMNSLFSDWQDKSICEITSTDIVNKHAEIIRNAQKRYKRTLGKEQPCDSNVLSRVGHSYADSAMRTLSSILSWAMWNYFPDKGMPLFDRNPVDILNRNRNDMWFKSMPRQERISDNQLSLWLTTLDRLRLENDEMTTINIGCDYLEFVLFTGLRRSEAANLKWDDIDEVNKSFEILETKNGVSLTVPLTEHLEHLLAKRKRLSGLLDEDNYVFPSMAKKGSPIVEPRYVAEKVTGISGIKFRIHDLRRTFISIAGKLLREPIVKALVNHKSGDVTAGYQHYGIEERREAMQEISEYILTKKRQGQLKIVCENVS